MYPRIPEKAEPTSKIISISKKRQITIPQKYFEEANFGNEAECIFVEGSIIIRPLRSELREEFFDEILEDLISQGFSGKELVEKFREARKKNKPAIGELVAEADRIAYGIQKAATINDVFTEDTESEE
jgi:bifunctional DNA-binding transcriptional regulator/antitoxin component of YhaV-PrlF toxin-antitoxin module